MSDRRAEILNAYKPLEWQDALDGVVLKTAIAGNEKWWIVPNPDNNQKACTHPYVSTKEPAHVTQPKAANTFNRLGEHVTVEEAVRAIEAYDFHCHEKRYLGRIEECVLDPLVTTPWGKPDHRTVYGPGVEFFSTPSHGGFRVSPEAQAGIPHHLRGTPDALGNLWYEEDCEYAKLIVARPDLFTDLEKQEAMKAFMFWYPDAWSLHHGQPVPEGIKTVTSTSAGMAPG